MQSYMANHAVLSSRECYSQQRYCQITGVCLFITCTSAWELQASRAVQCQGLRCPTSLICDAAVLTLHHLAPHAINIRVSHMLNTYSCCMHPLWHLPSITMTLLMQLRLVPLPLTTDDSIGPTPPSFTLFSTRGQLTITPTPTPTQQHPVEQSASTWLNPGRTHWASRPGTQTSCSSGVQ
jgi:hypothetical protein